MSFPAPPANSIDEGSLQMQSTLFDIDEGSLQMQSTLIYISPGFLLQKIPKFFQGIRR